MKITKYVLCLALACSMPACVELDVPPLNVVQNDDIFSSVNGINSYLARVYSGMPMEDFRYSPERGLFNFWALTPMCVVDGEAINRDQGGAQSENTKYWNDGYKSLRDINYFLETLPDYAAAPLMYLFSGIVTFRESFTKELKDISEIINNVVPF